MPQKAKPLMNSSASLPGNLVSRDGGARHGLADSAAVRAGLESDGIALTPPLLNEAECQEIRSWFGDTARFRNTVVVHRYGFGPGSPEGDSRPSRRQRSRGMTDNHNRFRADMLREQWTLAEGRRIQELFPPAGDPGDAWTRPGRHHGGRRHAVTSRRCRALSRVRSPDRQQPLRDARGPCPIAVLQRWLRVQRRSEPGDGLPWPAAFGGN